MSDTRGTFKGYDVVLSISQQAINKQLETLYNHQIPGAIIPVGARVKNGLPAAPAKYAINHEWQIRCEKYHDDDTNQDVIDPDVGIFAHLECPKIIFHGDDNSSATISITFRKDTSIADDDDPSHHQSSDSRFYFWGGSPRHPKLEFVVINGWTVSWQAKIQQADIEHDLEALIKRSSDPNDPVYVPPGLADNFKTIDPRAFTVASIFCLFESAKFVNTFSILNEHGQKPDESKLNNMMDHINQYFKGLAEAAAEDNKPIDGAPTPDVPFVLGYGLSQSVQNLRDINPSASWRETPAYFIPYRFDLTTTRASSEDHNTLNYCILTHSSKDPNNDNPRKIDITTDHNAGNLTESLIDVTRANYGDAVMGWACDTFWDKFVSDNIIPAHFIDPTEVVSTFMRARGVNDFQGNSSWDKHTDNIDDKSPGYYCRNIDYSTRAYDQGGTSLYGAEMSVSGYSKTVVKVSSDLQNAGGNSLPADHARRVYIRCESYFYLKADFETYAHVINPPRYRAYEGDITLRFCNNLVIEAGNGGTWQVTSTSDSQLPKFENGQLQFTDMGDSSPKDGQWGAYSEGHEFNNAHIFSPSDTKDQLKGAASVAASQEMLTLDQKLRATMNVLKTAIMMPGGEVFTFNGMDSDGSGNLYAHVSYALGGEGVKQT